MEARSRPGPPRRAAGGRRCGWALGVLLAVLACGPATGYKGGYYRYGTMSWQQTKVEADGITVRFTLKTAWAGAMFSRGKDDTPWGNCLTCSTAAADAARQCDTFGQKVQASCQLPVVGDRVALYDAVDTTETVAALGKALPWEESRFSFGDDAANSLTGARARTAPQYTPRCRLPGDVKYGRCIEGTVVESFTLGASVPTAEQNARDLVYVVSEITHKYPRQTKSYVAEFVGCCRLGYVDAGDLLNNAGGVWRVRSQVSLTEDDLVLETGTAASPFVAHVPVLTAVVGQPLEFQIHAYDHASRPVKYRIGDDSDYGADLTQSSQGQAAQVPFGNFMAATINADTGVLTFPASAATYNPLYYNLVVVVTSVGPCTGYVSTADLRRCSTPAGKQQTSLVTTTVDFLIRVVQTGHTIAGGVPGSGVVSSCTNVDSGLPPGTQVCNRMPVLSVPMSPQKFICNEHKSFEVSATDGDGTDKSVSQGPRGVFAIRYRQRFFLNDDYPVGRCSVTGTSPVKCTDDADCAVRNRGNCARTPNVPHFPRDEEPLWKPGNRAIAGSNSSTATATFSWTPLCEAPSADLMYSYRGPHRLETFAACFTAVDQGGDTEKEGKLVSPPKCVHIPVVRCTKPTVRLASADRGVSKYFWSTPTWVVPVSTNITLTFEATDDRQSKGLTIYHHTDHGIPALGAEWKQQQCSSSSSERVTCNPVQRDFFFSAELIHAGAQITICVEAVNDQAECPRYRKNNGNQQYGVHYSAAGIEVPPIMTSQASEASCFHLEVQGPDLQFAALTPEQDSTVVTYMGCPFELTLTAQDKNNHFDLEMEPWAVSLHLLAGCFAALAEYGRREWCCHPSQHVLDCKAHDGRHEERAYLRVLCECRTSLRLHLA